MSFFEWDSSLDVNVEEMNEQHRKLIGLMNDLHQKSEQGEAKEKLIEAADSLIAYTQKHFDDEESYMESIGFAGLEAHKRLHDNLMTELRRLADEFSNSDRNTLDDEFLTFLKTWLSTHIRGIDTKYGYGL